MSATETIRPFEPRDLDALLALRARCFPGLVVERERMRRRWTIDANPATRPGIPVTWIAAIDGEVVGTYGTLPARVFVDGTEEPAVCGVDFCVAPELRGKGLGRRLTAAMVDTPGSRLRFITSPTAATTALMQELGACVVDSNAEGALFARGGPFAPAAAAPAGLRVAPIAEFGAEFDTLAAAIARHHRFVVARDSRYLTWRYRGDPYVRHLPFAAHDPNGVLRGYAVLSLSPIEPQGYVADVHVQPQDTDAAHALLGAICGAAGEHGLHAMFALERRPALKPVLQQHGFHAVAAGAPEPVLLLRDQSVDPRDWQLSPGDGDFLFRIGGAG